jgi:hypothetical protein
MSLALREYLYSRLAIRELVDNPHNCPETALVYELDQCEEVRKLVPRIPRVEVHLPNASRRPHFTITKNMQI